MHGIAPGAWNFLASLSAALLCQLLPLAGGEYAEGRVSLGVGEWVLITAIAQDPPNATANFRLGLSQQRQSNWLGLLHWGDEVERIEKLGIRVIVVKDVYWRPNDYGPQGPQPCDRQPFTIMKASINKSLSRDESYPPKRHWNASFGMASSLRLYIWFVVFSTCRADAGHQTVLNTSLRESLWWHYESQSNGFEIAADVAPTRPFLVLSLILTLGILWMQRCGSTCFAEVSPPPWQRLLALAAATDAASTSAQLMGLEVIRWGKTLPEMMISTTRILELVTFALLSAAAFALAVPLRRSRSLVELYRDVGLYGFVAAFLFGLLLGFYGVLIADVVLHSGLWHEAATSLYLDRARVSGSPCDVVAGLALLVWLALLVYQAKARSKSACELGGFTPRQCFGSTVALLCRPLLRLICSYVSIHLRPLVGSILRFGLLAAVYIACLWTMICDAIYPCTSSAALLTERVYIALRRPSMARCSRPCALTALCILGFISTFRQQLFVKQPVSLRQQKPLSLAPFLGNVTVIGPEDFGQVLVDAEGFIHWPNGQKSKFRSHSDREWSTRVWGKTYRAHLEGEHKLVWDFGDAWWAQNSTPSTLTTGQTTPLMPKSTGQTTPPMPKSTGQAPPPMPKSTGQKPAPMPKSKTPPPSCIRDDPLSPYFIQEAKFDQVHANCDFGGLCGKLVQNQLRIDFLRNVTRVTKEMLSNASITDWHLASGTLIGAQRCEDVLPWDVDCDINLPVESINVLFRKFFGAFRLSFPRRSYTPFVELDDRYMLSIKGNCIPLTVIDSHSGLYCDLFPLWKAHGNIEMHWPWARKRVSNVTTAMCSDKGWIWPLSTVYPTRNCWFGGEQYQCPNDPDRHLAEWYGKNWRTPDIKSVQKNIHV